MRPVNPDVRAMVDAALKAGVRPLQDSDPQTARENYLAARRLDQPPLAPVASVVDINDGIATGVSLKVIRGVDTAEPLPCLLYFHGGGWTLGSSQSHEGICRSLALAARCCVISVDYRLAPENPFPAAVDDAIQALRYVVYHAGDLNIDRTSIALGGDSAGANLATVLALLGRDGQVPEAVYQLLFYPQVDLRMTASTFETAAEGMLVSAATIRWFVDKYTPNPAARNDWRVSPSLASSLSGLPPAFVLTCGLDPLGEEGRQYAARLEEEGCAVTALHISDQAHGFLNLGGAIKAASGVLAYAGFMLSEEWRHTKHRLMQEAT